MTAFDRSDTPAQRVARAIAQSGRKLEDLAGELGCTHATLSQWQRGTTNVCNAKADLLYRFAELTGTDVRWLLTGDGPAMSRYSLTPQAQRVSVALRAMERREPAMVERVVRMIEAAADEGPPDTDAPPAPMLGYNPAGPDDDPGLTT